MEISTTKPESTLKVGKYLIFSTGRIYDTKSGAFLFPVVKKDIIGYMLGSKFVPVIAVKELFSGNSL